MPFRLIGTSAEGSRDNEYIWGLGSFARRAKREKMRQAERFTCGSSGYMAVLEEITVFLKLDRNISIIVFHILLCHNVPLKGNMQKRRKTNRFPPSSFALQDSRLALELRSGNRYQLAEGFGQKNRYIFPASDFRLGELLHWQHATLSCGRHLLHPMAWLYPRNLTPNLSQYSATNSMI